SRGKTGTNDDSLTSGVRVGACAGTIGDRYSVSISGYITGASPRDKFTSGMAVQALKMLLPELTPLFDRSYGVTPQSIAAYEAQLAAEKAAKKAPAKSQTPVITQPGTPQIGTTEHVKQQFATSANQNAPQAPQDVRTTNLPAATIPERKAEKKLNLN
ncbi:MAG TPA: hypothetical protein VGD95_00365, partial [Micavibrio sp.]